MRTAKNSKPLCCLLLLIIIASLSVPASSESTISDSCDAHRSDSIPEFHVRYRRAWTYNGVRALTMNLSVSPNGIRQNRLVAIVCKVARDHTNKDVLVLWILDNDEAARRFRLTGQGISGSGFVVRASYSYDRRDGSQSLTWTPDVHDPSSSIKVALGVPQPERR